MHARLPSPCTDYEPPSFTRDVGVLQVLSGRPILVEVNVKGRPRPDVSWFKNGEPCKPFFDEPAHRVSISHRIFSVSLILAVLLFLILF